MNRRLPEAERLWRGKKADFARMRVFGRLLALLGLSFVVFASPSDEQFSFARSRQPRNPAPAPRLVASSTGFSPLSALAGGDTCGSPTPISTLPFSDTGTTSGMADLGLPPLLLRNRG